MEQKKFDLKQPVQSYNKGYADAINEVAEYLERFEILKKHCSYFFSADCKDDYVMNALERLDQWFHKVLQEDNSQPTQRENEELRYFDERWDALHKAFVNETGLPFVEAERFLFQFCDFNSSEMIDLFDRPLEFANLIANFYQTGEC